MSRLFLFFAGVLLALIGFSGVASACIWVDGTTLEGRPISHNDSSSFRSRLERAMEETPADKLRALDGLRKDSADNREKEAVRKILSGDPGAAILLLQKIEEEEPGKYSTAANLGTAYELAGDNRNALKWITEGMRRNSESHYRTEWLHALILEIKLRLESDPDYLKTHRVIPLPENFDRGTKIPIGGEERLMDDVMRALSYQLSERVVFVKPPDPIVADLLFTGALCEAHTGILESAVELLQKAGEYGFQDPALLKSTIDRYQAKIRAANLMRWAWRLGIALIGIGGAGLLYYSYRRKWFFLMPAAHRKYLAEKKAREQQPIP